MGLQMIRISVGSHPTVVSLNWLIRMPNSLGGHCGDGTAIGRSQGWCYFDETLDLQKLISSDLTAPSLSSRDTVSTSMSIGLPCARAALEVCTDWPR